MASSSYTPYTPKINEITTGSFLSKTENQIRGTGYVVASLEAALWSFFTTDSFDSAILKAANLGDDADTTAAICGQIAGAYYAKNGIRSDWLQRLHDKREIERLAVKLYELKTTTNM